MVFTTQIFLFYFLPLVLLIYYSLPFKLRNLFLTLASYLFYGWWEPWFVVLMMISTAMDFFCGRFISAPGASRARRLAGLLVAICGDMGLLAFFKYYMFTAENLNRLLPLVGRASFRFSRLRFPLESPSLPSRA